MDKENFVKSSTLKIPKDYIVFQTNKLHIWALLYKRYTSVVYLYYKTYECSINMCAYKRKRVGLEPKWPIHIKSPTMPIIIVAQVDFPCNQDYGLCPGYFLHWC